MLFFPFISFQDQSWSYKLYRWCRRIPCFIKICKRFESHLKAEYSTVELATLKRNMLCRYNRNKKKGLESKLWISKKFKQNFLIVPNRKANQTDQMTIQKRLSLDKIKFSRPNIIHFLFCIQILYLQRILESKIFLLSRRQG